MNILICYDCGKVSTRKNPRTCNWCESVDIVEVIVEEEE